MNRTVDEFLESFLQSLREANRGETEEFEFEFTDPATGKRKVSATEAKKSTRVS